MNVQSPRYCIVIPRLSPTFKAKVSTAVHHGSINITTMVASEGRPTKTDPGKQERSKNQILMFHDGKERDCLHSKLKHDSPLWPVSPKTEDTQKQVNPRQGSSVQKLKFDKRISKTHTYRERAHPCTTCG